MSKTADTNIKFTSIFRRFKSRKLEAIYILKPYSFYDFISSQKSCCLQEAAWGRWGIDRLGVWCGDPLTTLDTDCSTVRHLEYC